MGKIKDLAGQVFGRLTVVERAHQNKWGNYFWKCNCSCGNEALVVGGNLMTGIATSCGCYAKEVTLSIFEKHGMTGTAEYYSWQDIRSRCSGKTEKSVRDYVERGITIHPDFQDNFEAFYKEIGPRPIEPGIWSVGRINNNGNYTYGNLRWELPEQQARNRTKRVDNKTGVTGVSYSNGKFVAHCKLLSGTRSTKTFTVSKYGYDKAFELAVSARKEMIKALNAQGAGYSDTHGTEK
jgi:hypothetical protein